MKFAPPEKKNYCATIVRIRDTYPLDNCDNVVGTSIFGFQAIVSKDTKPGDLGVFFPAETQLSDDFVRENNLYRHEEYNADHAKKGYLEDNRRVKAIKFRGNTSSCLFMPLESMAPFMKDVSILEEGDEFDKIGDLEICRKYVVFTRRVGNATTPPKLRRVDVKHFPLHYDTENYFRNDRSIPDEHYIIVTQKLHGTSIRIANTIVKRKLTWKDRLARALGVTVQETEHSYVFGSRKVTKDPNNPDQDHYYEMDIWTQEGKKLEGKIPENFIVYGELVGWTPDGAPIQKGYTYQVPEKTCRLFVYRVAFVNNQGVVTDLSWDQVVEFCKQRGLETVPELARIPHKDFDVMVYLDKRLQENAHAQAIPLDPDTVDEGVCIRLEGLVPKIFKAKSSKFYEYETALLDKGEADLESTG